MSQIFDPDNLFWRIIAKGVDLVGLSLLWAILCLPIVTVGPATSALYYTVVKTFRQHNDGAFKMMLTAFRDNLKKGIPATLICIPIVILICYGYTVMRANAESSLGIVMFVAYYIALMVPVGMILYLFPLMGRFEMGLKDSFKTALILTIRHLPSTLIIVLLNVELIIFTIEKWYPLLFAPVGSAFLCSLFLERIFPKYLSVEDSAVLQDKSVQEVEKELAAMEQKKKKKK